MSDFQAIADRVEIEALRGELTGAAMMRDYDRAASLFATTARCGCLTSTSSLPTAQGRSCRRVFPGRGGRRAAGSLLIPGPRRDDRPGWPPGDRSAREHVAGAERRRRTRR